MVRLMFFRFFLIIAFTAIHISASGNMEVPLKQLLAKPNTIYKINRIYNLRGGVVKIPNNCGLIFTNKGKFVNGEIVGNNTEIQCTPGSIGVRLTGTWKVQTVKDDWFDSIYLNDNQILNNIETLQSDNLTQSFYLNKSSYYCSITKAGGSALSLLSNTTLYINSLIKLKPNDLKNYSVISIVNKKNVKICGGRIEGDVVAHKKTADGSLGEWGMGITINNSLNVKLENITIKYCWGDGIYIGGGKEPYIGVYKNASKKIVLSNIICDSNRRQGLSIVHVDGLLVEKSTFINTGSIKGTNPGSGVDIEPNLQNGKNQSCRDIRFVDCLMRDNKGHAFGSYNSLQEKANKSIEKIMLERCTLN